MEGTEESVSQGKTAPAPKKPSTDLATDLMRIQVEQEHSQKVDSYIAESIPDGEPRIEQQMDPKCEVAVVVPVYRERENVTRLLLSLARQKGVEPGQFEAVLVVNNPSKPPERQPEQTDDQFRRKLEGYHASIADNQATIALVRQLEAGVVPEGLSDGESAQLTEVVASGLRIHVIDKASEGVTLPEGEQNVGGARNRGVAEVVERFKYQAGHDGIIAQTDADCSLEPDYVAKLMTTFQDPEVVGVAGSARFEAEPEVEAIFTPAIRTLMAEYDRLYTRVLLTSLGKDGDRPGMAPGDVQFFGASMASRAFAAARVGGVPRIAGGEDPAFGRALQSVGSIVKQRDLIVHPLDRLSERTAENAGHGQKLNSAMDGIERTGNLVVNNPRSIPAFQEIVSVLQQYLSGDSEALGRLTMGPDNTPLITPGQEQEIREMGHGLETADQLLDAPAFQDIKSDISAQISEALPQVSVVESTDELIAMTLGDEPELRGEYETLMRNTLTAEEALIAERRLICEGYFSIVQPPNESIEDPGQVVSVLASHAAQLSLSDERLGQIQSDPRLLTELFRLTRESAGVGSAMAGMEVLYKDELTPVRDNPNMQAVIKLKSINQAHTKLQSA